MTVTRTTTDEVMERLRPCVETTRSAGLLKPRLARSSSLDRIRQFPAYLCSTRVVPHIFSTVVQTGIEQSLQLVRGSLLIIAVYLVVFVLLVQLSALVCALLTVPIPPGLTFMLASLCIMGGLVCQTVVHDSSLNRLNTRPHSD